MIRLLRGVTVGELLLAGLAVPPLACQQAGPPAAGQRVRVTLRDRAAAPCVGDLVLAGESTLAVRCDSNRVDRFALRDIMRLEVSRGWRSSAHAGATVGGLIGVVAGFVYGVGPLPRSRSCGSWDPIGCIGEDAGNALRSAGHVTLTLFVGGISGVLAGGAVGLLVRHEAWEALPLGGVRAAMVVLPGGRLGIGASLAL